MLTGKNEILFSEYVESSRFNDIPLDTFLELPFEMQKGVYEAYYDANGIWIENPTNRIGDGVDFCYFIRCKDMSAIDSPLEYFDGTNDRESAFTKALAKADEIMNKRLK